MAGIHRSSTLRDGRDYRELRARDGRDSPLKYTQSYPMSRARDGRDSPLKYTDRHNRVLQQVARDGRDSPLKYTLLQPHLVSRGLGMAGIHRSSTLPSTPRCAPDG